MQTYLALNYAIPHVKDSYRIKIIVDNMKNLFLTFCLMDHIKKFFVCYL